MSLVPGRRAARELALLILFQMENRQGQLPDALPADFNLLYAIRSATQSLTLHAEEQLESGADFFKKLYDQLADYEFEHPTNINAPMDALRKPVALANTQQTLAQVKDALNAIELVCEALHVPQLIAQATLPEVTQYCDRLLKHVLTHCADIDAIIEHYSTDWKTSRLAKMDRIVLRLALAELLHEDRIDHAVSINEAVDLAKQYSQDDSYKFVNGLLGRVVEQLKARQPLLPASTTTGA